MSNNIKIEFFHDVICSFCFPMAYRMRKIANKYSNIEIIHRSFALGWSSQDFIQQFGSRAAVKSEVLNHWQHANAIDDAHRFNIQGMQEKSFDFPLSRPGLIAAKAAGLIGGESLYWDAFDAIQHGLFVENLNIEDSQVLQNIMATVNLDLKQWQEKFEADETEKAVIQDIQRAHLYGIYSAPALLINEKYILSGAQPQEMIEQALAEVAKREKISLKVNPIDLTINAGLSCSLVEGQWQCDDFF